MSLNWKEINLILNELDLQGAQIQSAVQSAYDVIVFRIHKTGKTKQVLISLSSDACRIHETFRAVPKSDKPLRFAQFLSSKIVNGWIIQARQLDDNRIIHLKVKHKDTVFNLYIRLWSNAANFIVTDEEGIVLDAMRRLPKRGEVTGKLFSADSVLKRDHLKNIKPDQKDEHPASDDPRLKEKKIKIFEIRDIPGDESFNKKIDDFYASQGGALSLESLREQLRRGYEGSLARINAALEKLKEKERSFENAEKFKIYGDLILSNIASIKPGDKWLEVKNDNQTIRVELNFKTGDRSESARFDRVTPAMAAGRYYEQYRKAKNGLGEIQREIQDSEKELNDISEKLDKLLSETNPLILAKLLRHGGASSGAKLSKKEKTRPGLSFKRGEWLILVGRDARENDELLRRHVKGNDMWLHARDYHGSYVFIKQRAGKSVPLDILLDAGNLAIFYSKGRNNGEGDLFYTQVKYLRRAKDGPKGLVIPTQEKNLRVKLDDKRLRSLENCRV
ncbi:MAG: NFACT family protein [Treponema sp.]|nr:NFACT family protein [Treponema sp.]